MTFTLMPYGPACGEGKSFMTLLAFFAEGRNRSRSGASLADSGLDPKR